MVSASRKAAQKVKDLPIVGIDSYRKKGARGKAADQGIRYPQVGTAASAGFGDQILDDDRLWAAQREPVAHRITYTVAGDIFDNWFEVGDPTSEGPDAELDRKVQAVLSDLNAKSILTDAAAYKRIFGYSLVVVASRDAQDIKALATERNPGAEITELEVYKKTDVATVTLDMDENSERFGLPLMYRLNRGSGSQFDVHFSRVIRIPTKPGELDEYSVLDSVWDDLTAFRNIRWGMGQTMFRYGGGFPVVTIKGATRQQLQDWASDPSMANFTARTFYLQSDLVDFKFAGIEGVALNPQNYYNPIFENISIGSGIPSAILRGAQAGTLAGSEVNEREYFKVISSLQSKYEPFVRQLIDMLIASGQIAFKGDYELKWKAGSEPSELTVNQADLVKEQANQIRLEYMTVDEVRAEMGFKSLPNGEGTALKQKPQPQPFGGTGAGISAFTSKGLASADIGFLYISKCKSQTCGFVFDSLRDPQQGDVSCPKCKGPTDLWQGDNPPVHLQEFDQPGEHPSFARLLHAIVDRAKAGKIDRSLAITEAQKVIEDYGKIEDQRALVWVRHRAGRPDITLSPEVQVNLQNKRLRHLEDFKAILDDALKAGGSHVPASPN